MSEKAKAAAAAQQAALAAAEEAPQLGEVGVARTQLDVAALLLPGESVAAGLRRLQGAARPGGAAGKGKGAVPYTIVDWQGQQGGWCVSGGRVVVECCCGVIPLDTAGGGTLACVSRSTPTSCLFNMAKHCLAAAAPPPPPPPHVPPFPTLLLLQPPAAALNFGFVHHIDILTTPIPADVQ